PQVSPPGSPSSATVRKRQASLPVLASYALMKHFSSRYVAQESRPRPVISRPLTASGPLLLLYSPLERSPTAVSQITLPLRASKAIRCAPPVLTKILSS